MSDDFKLLQPGNPGYVDLGVVYLPSADSAYLGSPLSENDPHWHCELFGTGTHGIVLHPAKGKVPNRFWRWMQFLCFGNRWVYEK